MALILGTNCGFVLVAPTADPAATNSTIDNTAFAFKVTSPAGILAVTEIGWYCDNATQAANYEVAIYDHDAINDVPNAIIGSALINAKGTGAGWKAVTGLNIAVSALTVYWIAVQLDDTTTGTSMNVTTTSFQKWSLDTAQATLNNPWQNTVTQAQLIGNYAVYSLAPTGSQTGFMTTHPQLWGP